MPDFYTQATNFLGANKVGVDPRTGSFGFALQLGRLLGNRGLGPSLPIVLSYHPVASRNGPHATGFGAGVSLGITTYDITVNPGRITLSTGEQYVVDEDNDTLSMRQKKLKDVTFEKIVSENNNHHYQIAYKSGRVEILDGSDNPYDVKGVNKIINNLGYSLNLLWSYESKTAVQWNPPRLLQISDESEILLSIDYVDDSQTTLTFFPGHVEGYEIKLQILNDYLTQIDNYAVLDGGNPVSWKLDYDVVGDEKWGQWLTKVTFPGKLTKQVNYSADENTGAKFPGDAKLPRLPRVYRYIADPGSGGVQMETTYAYADGSFLGSNASTGIPWNKNADYLLGNFDRDYVYSTTETRSFTDAITEKKVSVATVYSYNSYHLLCEQSRSQGNSSRSTVTTYYASDGSFESQPPQYQKAKSTTTSWRKDGATRSVVLQTEYDEYGNMTSRTNPSPSQGKTGIKTRWEFYPFDGSDSGCPKDKYEFKRFVKKITITPADSDYRDEPIESVEYQYSDVPGGTSF